MIEPAAADRDAIQAAFRLGWAMSEVDGRTRVGLSDPGAPQDTPRSKIDLPLYSERNPEELLIESRSVLAGLAAQLAADVPQRDLKGWQPQPKSRLPASYRLEHLTEQIMFKRDPTNYQTTERESPQTEEELVLEFEGFMYAWDAHTQDLLARGPYGRSSAYQLGRGLADIAWAFRPDAEEGTWNSWTFLLGTERVDYLEVLLDRIAPFLRNEFVSPAIKDSLEIWQRAFAGRDPAPTDPAVLEEWRKSSATLRSLRQQTQRWRDLVVIDQDPTVLTARPTGLQTSRILFHALATLWPQLAITAFGIGGLVAGALLLPSDKSGSGVAAVLGAAGITAGTLSGRAKASAQALREQLRAEFNREVAVRAACVPPNPPRPSTSGVLGRLLNG